MKDRNVESVKTGVKDDTSDLACPTGWMMMPLAESWTPEEEVPFFWWRGGKQENQMFSFVDVKYKELIRY